MGERKYALIGADVLGDGKVKIGTYPGLSKKNN